MASTQKKKKMKISELATITDLSGIIPHIELEKNKLEQTEK